MSQLVYKNYMNSLHHRTLVCYQVL